MVRYQKVTRDLDARIERAVGWGWDAVVGPHHTQ